MPRPPARKAGRGLGLSITGDAQLDKALVGLGPKLGRKALMKGLRAGAKVMKTAVQARAPEDSGDLKGSVKVKAGKRTRKARARINVQIGEGDFKGETYYAAMVEFGTKKQPPQGYMRAAFDEQGPEARGVALSVIAREVFDEAKSSAKGK